MEPTDRDVPADVAEKLKPVAILGALDLPVGTVEEMKTESDVFDPSNS